VEPSVVAGWSELLTAVAGTAGALVGLVFVALSINLARILALPGVSGRAAETIVLLARWRSPSSRLSRAFRPGNWAGRCWSWRW
jgi:hypothetical protein